MFIRFPSPLSTVPVSFPSSNTPKSPVPSKPSLPPLSLSLSLSHPNPSLHPLLLLPPPPISLVLSNPTLPLPLHLERILLLHSRDRKPFEIVSFVVRGGKGRGRRDRMRRERRERERGGKREVLAGSIQLRVSARDQIRAISSVGIERKAISECERLPV